MQIDGKWGIKCQANRQRTPDNIRQKGRSRPALNAGTMDKVGEEGGADAP